MGELYGEASLGSGGVSSDTITAVEPTVLARIPAETVLAEARSTGPARRAAVVSGLPPLARSAVGVPTADVILPVGGEPGFAPGPFVGALAAATASYGDRVYVLHLVRGEARPPPPPGGAVHHRLVRLDGRAPVDLLREAAEAVCRETAAEVPDPLRRFAYTFVDPGDLAPTGLGDLAPAVTRVVQVDQGAVIPGPVSALWGRPHHHVVLVGDPTRVDAPVPITRSVRLRADLAALAALDPYPPSLETLEPRLREGFLRVARGLTGRLVGLALGGGGAPGYAHIALIRAMHTAGVPIDMVAGTSFGAFVAGFYCTLGLDGLQLMIDQGRAANFAIRTAFLTSRTVQEFVDRNTGHQQLQSVEVPFYPIASDLDAGTAFVPRAGTVGSGVRASGAFPLIFTPLSRSPSGRYVDGGFVNNVPVSEVLQRGASLTIGSAVVAPAPVRRGEPLLPGRVGRYAQEFNPVARVTDVFRAALLMFDVSGGRESRGARATFRPRFSGIAFWDFARGEEIVEAAREQAQEFSYRLRQVWHEVRGPEA